VSKKTALAELVTALEDPAAEKDGNILAELLHQKARLLLQSDRAGLIEALREWLEARDDILSVQAALLIGDFQLAELRAELEHIRNEVAARQALRPSSMWLFDKALARIGEPDASNRGGP